jgi:hypothetical protein
LDAIFLYSQFLLHRCSIVASVDAIFFFFFFLHSSYVSLEKHLTGEAKREKSLILLSCHLDFTIEKNKNEDSRVIGMKRRNFKTTKKIEEKEGEKFPNKTSSTLKNGKKLSKKTRLCSSYSF